MWGRGRIPPAEAGRSGDELRGEVYTRQHQPGEVYTRQHQFSPGEVDVFSASSNQTHGNLHQTSSPPQQGREASQDQRRDSAKHEETLTLVVGTSNYPQGHVIATRMTDRSSSEYSRTQQAGWADY